MHACAAPRGRAGAGAAGVVTFGEMLDSGPGFTTLAEQPGREFVVGAIGRFWRKDYGGRAFEPDDFVSFDEAGYAKLAVGFSVTPIDEHRCRLRYEARTATTDAVARRRFRSYWRVIRPGVAMIMRRALALIRKEAELRAAVRTR